MGEQPLYRITGGPFTRDLCIVDPDGKDITNEIYKIELVADPKDGIMRAKIEIMVVVDIQTPAEVTAMELPEGIMIDGLPPSMAEAISAGLKVELKLEKFDGDGEAKVLAETIDIVYEKTALVSRIDTEFVGGIAVATVTWDPVTDQPGERTLCQ